MRYSLDPIDLVVFIVYAVGLLALALWISREEKSHNRSPQE